ncbi:MAG: hypothetical protein U9O06_10380 [Euryarchaeota archaeon]|nr:hypothetical protein [Euryarchaeota archaeon]
MEPGVPIRISACWLHGDNQYPERGLFYVSEDEAELITRIAVLEMARERVGDEMSAEDIYAEVWTILNELEGDLREHLLGKADIEDC